MFKKSWNRMNTLNLLQSLEDKLEKYLNKAPHFIIITCICITLHKTVNLELLELVDCQVFTRLVGAYLIKQVIYIYFSIFRLK